MEVRTVVGQLTDNLWFSPDGDHDIGIDPNDGSPKRPRDVYIKGLLRTQTGTGVSGVGHQQYETSGRRWVSGLLGTESGSNVGADLALWSYNDSGVFIRTHMRFYRSTGVSEYYSPIRMGAAPTGAHSVFTGAGIQVTTGAATFVGANVTTDATRKTTRLATCNYNNATAPFLWVRAVSDDGANTLQVGGGDGSFTPASSVAIFTSAAPGTAGPGTQRWHWNSAGNYVASADNVYDLGASGANRPRSGFFGTSWFNNSLNVVKYWNGSAVKTVTAT